MIFERIKSEGLSHNSYFIGSGDEAAVIDPRRDCDVYIETARREEVKIKLIFETHRNEDYVIGSVGLSSSTGAKIFHGPGLEWGYGDVVKDGDVFFVGDIKITALHTPGHTDESMSYILSDLSSGEEPVMVFTGDALFVGEVGRTDLYGKEETPRLAGMLYDSIFNKILPLGDGVILCPAHGAGSVCGSDISERDESTLGIEKLQNPMLKFANREEFIKYKVEERHELPPYFEQMEIYNLEGSRILRKTPVPPALTPEEFEKLIEKGAVIVDTRPPPAFGGAHIRNSYSIWLEGLPAFAGWVLKYEKPLLLVLESGSEIGKAVNYLMRLGYDNIAGYGGVEAWYNSGLDIDHTGLYTVHELKRRLDRGEELLVLDVRGDKEWNEGHIKDALHIYVGQLERRLGEIPRDHPIAVLCNVGRRASLGASILLRAGFENVSVVLGSMKAWRASNYPLSAD